MRKMGSPRAYEEGIARNEVTQYLWSEDALRTFERIGIQRGKLEVYSKVEPVRNFVFEA